MRKLALAVLVCVVFLVGIALAFLNPPLSAEGRWSCRIEPRSQVEVVSLVGGPTDTLIVPSSAPRPNPYPDAHLPALDDDETFRALVATIHGAVAAAEAGDSACLYAHYSDGFLRQALDTDPIPGSSRGLPVVPVWRGSWLLDDGRVGMVFSEPQTESTPNQGDPIYFVFVGRDGRWVIDDAVPFDGPHPGPLPPR